MKKLLIVFGLGIALVVGSCSNQSSESSGESAVAETADQAVGDPNDIKPEYLTAATFREKVWDYEKNPDAWVYNGDLPCIVDFYADWCKPCKRVAPIMDDLADYYDGRVMIYKVDTDKEKELASVFQVRSIPSILFAPSKGNPAIQPGALSKDDYIRIIDEFVLKVNEQNNEKTEI
jgi:thioredoxin